MPGRLSDVFGIRTEEFYRPNTPPEMNLNGKTEKASIGFYEVLEPRTAKPMAMFTNTPEKSPAITVNKYRERACNLCRRSCADGGAGSACAQPLCRAWHRKGRQILLRRVRARGEEGHYT